MSLLTHHATEAPQRSITVRELERHGVSRLGERFAALVLPGAVKCCAACAAIPGHLVSLLDGRDETERADVLYGHPDAGTACLAALGCTGHRERHHP